MEFLKNDGPINEFIRNKKANHHDMINLILNDELRLFFTYFFKYGKYGKWKR